MINLNWRILDEALFTTRLSTCRSNSGCARCRSRVHVSFIYIWKYRIYNKTVLTLRIHAHTPNNATILPMGYPCAARWRIHPSSGVGPMRLMREYMHVKPILRYAIGIHKYAYSKHPTSPHPPYICANRDGDMTLQYDAAVPPPRHDPWR